MSTRPAEKHAPEDQNDTRGEILAQAAKLIFDQGYEATTMRQIAARLKIKPGSLYYHFESKQDILFELVTSTVRPLTAGAIQLTSLEPEPELKLAAVVINHVVLHALKPTIATLADSELRSLDGHMRDEHLRARDEYEAVVIEVLRRGARAGRFDLLDPKLVAYALIAQSSNLGIWYDPAGRLRLERIASIHVAVAMRVVAADPIADADVKRICDAARAFHS